MSVEQVGFRIGQLLYLMSPAYAANMAPPFVKYWKGWNRPISRRWFGSHKTVIGFAAGVLAAVVVSLVQSFVDWKGSPVGSEEWLGLGLRLGTGAMAGDTAKSFLKRRVAIPPGRPWIPFDQMDFVLGALAFVWGRAPLSWSDGVIIIGVSIGGHILINRLGYWLGVRDTKW